MGRPLGLWARDEDGARTGLPFMMWCARSYIEKNPEGQYYSTKSRYCNTPPRVQALGSEEEEEEEEEHLELVM